MATVKEVLKKPDVEKKDATGWFADKRRQPEQEKAMGASGKTGKRHKPSAVTITCRNKDREELKTAFMEFFMNRLKEELKTLQKDFRNFPRTLAEFAYTIDWEDFEWYYGAYQVQSPFRFANAAKGLKIMVDYLTINLISPGGNDYFYRGYGEQAFINALRDLKKTRQDIHYEGTVHYMAADSHDGMKVEFSVSDQED